MKRLLFELVEQGSNNIAKTKERFTPTTCLFIFECKRKTLQHHHRVKQDNANGHKFQIDFFFRFLN